MRADVVVVGGGGSGLAAAVGAANKGARVILLEKNPECGGTTACSIGSISSTQTEYQRRAGIVDSPAEHYADMDLFLEVRKISRPDNNGLRRLLTENVPETMRWLGAMGVVFYGPLEEKPHRKPRMHNVMPNSRAYIFHLEREARRLGVTIINGAQAKRFVTSGRQVTGVEFLVNGNLQTVQASRCVVLASGDYAADPEFKREFISPEIAATEAINPTSTGDGQRMAQELGAKIINGDMWSGGMRFIRPAKPAWVSQLPPSRWLMKAANFALRWAPGFISRRFIMSFLTTVLVPTPKMYASGAILINKKGERFTSETKGMPYELPNQPEGMAYIFFDANIAEKFSQWPNYISTAPGIAYAFLPDYRRNRPDLFNRADTIQELAAQIGVPPDVLAKTIENYNKGAGETDANVSVPARGERPAIIRSPFYALGPCKNYVHYTEGGLAVSDKLEVLDADGKPIPGLLAAGSVGQGGGLLKGHGHHLGWAFTSGRLAGQFAAARQVGES